jgi:hypothetical protein
MKFKVKVEKIFDKMYYTLKLSENKKRKENK